MCVLLHGLYSRKEGRRARRPETGDQSRVYVVLYFPIGIQMEINHYPVAWVVAAVSRSCPSVLWHFANGRFIHIHVCQYFSLSSYEIEILPAALLFWMGTNTGKYPRHTSLRPCTAMQYSMRCSTVLVGMQYVKSTTVKYCSEWAMSMQ